MASGCRATCRAQRATSSWNGPGKADAGPFSSLGVIDRLVYDNYEPLITLAAAAGATSRVRLMTCVLLAPLRNTGVLAKEAATLDAISGGRLTLGVGVGRRPDDYQAAPSAFEERGRRLSRALTTMKRVWNSEGAAPGVGPMGPAPVQSGGPEVLVGAGTPPALRRAGRYADGFIAAAGSASAVEELFAIVQESWDNNARPGKPRLAGVASYALGPNAADQVGGYIRHYYSFLGRCGGADGLGTPSPPPKPSRTPSGTWKASAWTKWSSCLACQKWTKLERLAEIII